MNDEDLRAYKVLSKLKLVKLTKGALALKDGGIKGLNTRLKKKRVWKQNQNVDNRVFEYIEFKKQSIDIVVDLNVDILNVLERLKDLKIKYNLFYLMEKPKEKNNYYGISYLFLQQYFLYRSFIYVSKNGEFKNQKDFYNCIVIKDDNDLVSNINELFESIDTLKVISNYNNKNNITVKTATFFDYKGTNYYSGGAERYLVDLHQVCKDNGYNLDVYQNADKPFFRKFGDVNVIGLSNPTLPLNYSMEYIVEQARNYSCTSKYFSQLHIYSAFFECYPYCMHPSVGISHGIAWDGTNNVKTNGTDFWNRNEQIIESACMCDKLVSVDTNTANWFQTIDYTLGNQKMKVISNYVDTNEFKPVERKKNGKIVITYPRRLYEPRGMYLLLDVVDDLFKKYDNLEIRFVGKGFDEDIKNIENKMKKYPNKILCYSSIPTKMHEVYEQTDISLIPTLYSEGTSLSCLEALSTGNIVISTRIGGLCDLIIDGYNGYLIEPTKEDLFNKICHIIDNYDKQDEIRKRARESAKTFNKDIWSKKWSEVIKSFDLKTKSENIDLVEFYVEDVTNLSNNTFDMIKNAILNNELVYIRSYKELENDNISNGLLQLVPFAEEVVANSKKVYVESLIKNKVDRQNVIVIDKEK